MPGQASLYLSAVPARCRAVSVTALGLARTAACCSRTPQRPTIFVQESSASTSLCTSLCTGRISCAVCACPRPRCCRIEERAAGEADQEVQLALRKLGRRLATVHGELSLYQQLIDKFRWGCREHPPSPAHASSADRRTARPCGQQGWRFGGLASQAVLSVVVLSAPETSPPRLLPRASKRACPPAPRLVSMPRPTSCGLPAPSLRQGGAQQRLGGDGQPAPHLDGRGVLQVPGPEDQVGCPAPPLVPACTRDVHSPERSSQVLHLLSAHWIRFGLLAGPAGLARAARVCCRRRSHCGPAACSAPRRACTHGAPGAAACSASLLPCAAAGAAGPRTTRSRSRRRWWRWGRSWRRWWRRTTGCCATSRPWRRRRRASATCWRWAGSDRV